MAADSQAEARDVTLHQHQEKRPIQFLPQNIGKKGLSVPNPECSRRRQRNHTIVIQLKDHVVVDA